MISAIFEIVAELVFEIVFTLVCYFVGRIVVEAFTLGHIKCQTFSMKVPNKKLRGGGLYFRRGKRIYLTDVAVSGIGMFSLILLAATAGLMHWLSTSV